MNTKRINDIAIVDSNEMVITDTQSAIDFIISFMKVIMEKIFSL